MFHAGRRVPRRRAHPSSREPPLDPRTCAGDCAGVGRPIGTVRVDRRAMLVDPDFHAAVLHVGDAVYPSRTIDPRWCGPRAEAFVAGRRAGKSRSDASAE